MTYQLSERTFSKTDLTQIFIGQFAGGAASCPISTWRKPPAISFVELICVGGGSGGGGGGASAAATIASGGGGGGCGGATRVLLPAFAIPDILYIRPGKGGIGATGQVQGGAAAGTPDAGGQSNIYIGNTSASILCTDCASSAGVGQSGSGSTRGLGGTAASIATALGMNAGQGHLWLAIAGIAGGAGGTNGAAGTAVASCFGSYTTGNAWACGGAGGGGVNAGTTTTAGGDITCGVSNIPTLTPSATAGTNGWAGYDFIQQFGNSFLPPFGTGGTGGSGGTSAGVGGAGGNGAPGSGGGGGGGSNGTASVGGAGGNGGPGFVIITCW